MFATVKEGCWYVWKREIETCYQPVYNRAVHPSTQKKTKQREKNLLIKLNDRGPFHHLSHKLEEIDWRKERSSTPVILFPHLQHTEGALQFISGNTRGTDIWHVNKMLWDFCSRGYFDCSHRRPCSLLRLLVCLYTSTHTHTHTHTGSIPQSTPQAPANQWQQDVPPPGHQLHALIGHFKACFLRRSPQETNLTFDKVTGFKIWLRFYI